MIDVGITDDDILIIRKQDAVNDGDIAVVVIPEQEQATLKRVFRKPQSILLKAENDSFPNIIVSDCEVRGKLVNVIRQL